MLLQIYIMWPIRCCKDILCDVVVVVVVVVVLLLLLFKRRYVWHLSWKDVLCGAFNAKKTIYVMLLLKSCCVWHWSWRENLEMLYVMLLFKSCCMWHWSWRDHLEMLYVMLLKSCYMWRIRCSRDSFYDIIESVGGWVAVPRIPEFRLAFDVRNL
jgi:hypothetical protein